MIFEIVIGLKVGKLTGKAKYADCFSSPAGQPADSRIEKGGQRPAQ
jgi:hypothetical protein